MQSFEPIAAISTPYGRGGIAVVRMSGEGSAKLAEKMFVPKNGKPLSCIEHSKAVYGDIYFEGKKIDDGIATVFYAPNSYTGEETVEISCHGGIILTQNVLTAALESGFRAALAGEFTKRAFLNGKLSLTQAEAVIGLIDAESQEQLKLSTSIMLGVLSKELDNVCQELTNILASVYAYIDYPDEDLTDMSVDELISKTERVYTEIDKLCKSYRSGKAVSEGIKTVIVGKPNAGKSSLLNRFLGYNRAIVTDIAGTTRDTIEESATVGRVTLRLCDTAGIRDTPDKLESLGIDRSIEKLNEAELVIAVFDGSKPLDDEDNKLIELLNSSSAEKIYVLNKTDLQGKIVDFPYTAYEISALIGDGIEELENAISALFVSEKLDYNTTPVIANARQFASASLAKDHVHNALDALMNGYTQDVAGMDLELALSSLKDIDGRGASEEITDRIFMRFCVGK